MIPTLDDLENGKTNLCEVYNLLSDLSFRQDPVRIVEYIKKHLNSNDASVICNASNSNIPPDIYYYLRRGHASSIYW